MADDRSILQKIGDTITDIAPGLATACALIPGVGTIPAAALGAVSMLGKALGLGSQAKPEEVLTAVTSITDPTVRQNIINAENAFQLAMRDQDIKVLQVNNETLGLLLKDTGGARERDTTIRTSGKLNVRADLMLAGAFICIVVIVFVLAFSTMDAGSAIAGFLMTVGGALLKDIGTAFDFEFGASRIQVEQAQVMAASSARKTDIIEGAMTVGQQPPKTQVSVGL